MDNNAWNLFQAGIEWDEALCFAVECVNDVQQRHAYGVHTFKSDQFTCTFVFKQKLSNSSESKEQESGEFSGNAANKIENEVIEEKSIRGVKRGKRKVSEKTNPNHQK